MDKFVPLSEKKMDAISSIGTIMPLREKYVRWSDVLLAVEELKRRINDYRKSNELWRKSQDENLDDFEVMIDGVFRVKK